MLKLRRPRLGALNLTLLAIVLALGGGGTWLVFGDSNATRTAVTATATVTRTDVTSMVSADGTVTPNDSADVSFDTAGIISAIAVEVGDEVAVGDVLAQVSSSTASARLKSAKASLEAAEDAEDAVKDADDDTRSDEDRERDESSAKAQVEQARLTLAEVQDALNDLTLRAPVAGTVTAINSTVGSATDNSADGSTGQGGTFATIADMSSWVVECTFSEADVAKVEEGNEVEITFGAVPNETFTGRIRRIDLSATTAENVTSYGVEVDVLNAPSELRDGASASVTVTTASATNVLAVPTSAVTTDANGQSTVQLVKDGTSTSRTVQIGIKGDTYTEITSGLSVGDTVELGATSTSSDNTGPDFRVGRGPGAPGAGGAAVVRGAGG